MSRFLAFLALLFVIVGTPAPAAAVQLGESSPGSVLEGSTLSVNNTFYYKYNLFLDDDKDDEVPAPFAFHEFVNRLSADLRIKRFTLGAQFDLVGVTPNCSQDAFRRRFADRYGDDAACVPPNTVLGDGWAEQASDFILVRPEKVYLRYVSRSVDISVGDYYAAFGRGIVLSFVKQPEIDSDNSLLGARVDVRTKPLDFTVLGGISNPQEVSMELRNRGIDKTEWTAIAGASVKLRPAKGLTLTAHGVGYNLQETPSGAVGGTFGANGLGGVVDLFAEGDAFLYGYENRDEALANGLPGNGYAIYASGTAYAGPLTLLLEFKRYKDAQRTEHLVRGGPIIPLQFTKPPSLEHEASITEDINGSVQSNDITGWRLQGELWFLSTDTTLTAAFANSVDNEPHPPFSTQREVTIHPTLALEQPIHTEKVDLHLKGDIGYRHDFPLRSVDGDPDDWLRNTGMLHYRADIGVTFGKHAIELVSTYRRHSITLESEACWTRNDKEFCDKDDGWIAWENALSYTLMGKYTVALHVDYTDDPIVQSLANGGAIGNLWYDEDFVASAYVGGELILKPISNLEIYVFWGSQKSGIVCTGGACRTVPAFTGVKGKVSVNF
jgi:hypothetical protein